ncbi:MAG: hypothetical protein WAM39_17650 [Bryobacteraceae bacterium]
MRFVICAVLAILLTAGHSQCEQSAPPPQLYISKGACPFECCTYQTWIANRTVALVDHPGGKVIAQVRKGEEVQGITGEVETHPLRFQIKEKGLDFDKRTEPVPVGSTVYLLHPVGEGFWLVWFNGKIIQMDPEYVGPGPEYQWWAKVKTKSGHIGWVRMNAKDLSFDNVDRCACANEALWPPQSDTPREAGGLMSWAASKAVEHRFRRRAIARLG